MLFLCRLEVSIISELWVTAKAGVTVEMTFFDTINYLWEGNVLSRIIISFFFLFVFSTTSFAAQSTADVPVSSTIKNSVLKEIRGAKAKQFTKEDEYIIGHGDILTVSIFEEGDMSASAAAGISRQNQTDDAPRVGETGTRVRMDGRVSLRDIGDVEVVGLTLTELADYLKKLYSSIFDDPIVTTTLVQSNSLRYTVMGEVEEPGIFFLDYPMTIVQVIARSAGFTEWGGKDITVVREKLKETDKALFKGNTLKFDYDDFISGKGLKNNVFIRSGDIIIVK